MTINALHRQLTKLVEAGHGRRKVCIDKESFKHPLEPDGCVILPVEDAEIRTFEIMDGDGGAELLADGTIKTETSLVLVGD